MQHVDNQEGSDRLKISDIQLKDNICIENTRKSFEELQSRSQRHLRIEDTIVMLEDVAKREKITLASLLGYIGHTRYYNSNKKLALLFQSIWHGNEPDTSKDIPIETAVYLKEKNLI